ncbi:MAG: alpha/beta hydrolase fold domain-containing protein [Planctomycetota bacterium]|nr:alpha/beta hydrolase fold domain-containing protein [Planctomycetota bacterium]
MSTPSSSEPTPPLRIEHDLLYREGTNVTAYQNARCRLDLYLPTQTSNFPLLLWFHGGGLIGGEKNSPRGVEIGRRFANEGVGVAMATYRFAPEARFPDFARDAAAAVAFVARHIASFGGDPGRIFVSGHSAGGYLAALRGLDAACLRDAGVDERRVAGLIPVSGQMVTHFTIRGQNGVPDAGTRPVIDAAAPCYHARADAAPTLLIAGGNDMAMRTDENRYLAALLRTAGHRDVQYLEFPGRDHSTIVDLMVDREDPVYAAIMHFIRRLPSRMDRVSSQ